MKVGDIIKRKAKEYDKWCIQQNDINGYGLVLKREVKYLDKRSHTTPILTVYYCKTGKISTVAETLMEVISESG